MFFILSLLISFSGAFVWNHEYDLKIVLVNNVPSSNSIIENEMSWSHIAGYIQQLKKQKTDKVIAIHVGNMQEKSILSSLLNFEPDYKSIGLIGFDAILINKEEASYFQKELIERQELAKKKFIISNYEMNKVGFKHLFIDQPTFFESFEKIIFQDISIAVLNYLPQDIRKDKFINELGLQYKDGKNTYAEFFNKFPHRFDINLVFSETSLDLNKMNFNNTIVFSNSLKDKNILPLPQSADELVEIHLKYKNGIITKRKLNVLNFSTLNKFEDKKIKDLNKMYAKRLDHLLKEKVGELVKDYDFNYQFNGNNKNFWGHLILKSYQRFFKAQIAFFDYANIQQLPQKGPIYFKDIVQMFNHKNEICLVSILGRELQDYLSYLTFKFPQNAQRKPVGIGFKFTQTENDEQENYLLIGDKFLRQNKIYKIVLPRPMLIGDEYYPSLDTKNTFECSSLKEHQVFSYYLKGLGQI